MANPQIEDGHIDVANEIAEAIAKTYLSPSESKVLWAIMRKTWGWHKKKDRISYTQFEGLTLMDRRHIAPALKRLIARNIITQTGNGQRLEYGIQKDYERWQTITETGNARHEPLLKPVTASTITDIGNTPLLKQVTEPLPISVNTKEKKETIQKKDIYIVVFDFWNSRKIIEHKKLTDDIKRAINNILASYSMQDVCRSIRNYAEILSDDQYYFKYRWTLKDFLKRGLEKFMDLEVAKSNYWRDKDKSPARCITYEDVQ